MIHPAGLQWPSETAGLWYPQVSSNMAGWEIPARHGGFVRREIIELNGRFSSKSWK